MPTADLFVQLWSWEENGVTMTPRISRIQAVLDGDGETNPLTSTTATPLVSKKINILSVIKRNYGKLPYLCPCCELRFATKQKVQAHHNLAHKSKFEWQMPQPSVDPAHQEGNGEFDKEGEKEGEEQLAEEVGLNDEESSEEEGPVVKKRKR